MHKVTLAILFIFILILLGCMEKYPPQSPSMAVVATSGCIDCHTNQDLLKQIATPLPPDTGSSGEG